VEDGVHFGDFADDDPGGGFVEVFFGGVGVGGHGWGLFVADGAHVVVEAVVDVCLCFVS